jgi:Raf kinase inhibitor-like YbhB/YbcL family protein
MQVTSSAFSNGARIPAEYAKPPFPGGANVSPPLSWSGEPSSTKSLAIAMIDVNPVAHGWVHWLVADIPVGVMSLPAGASGSGMPPGAVELTTTFGSAGYGGPVPPRGTGDHRYEITVYALGVERTGLAPSSTFADFQRAVAGHVLTQATISGVVSQ